MRVDGSWPSPRLHLDPTQARLVLDAELGLGMGNDAATYLSAALQHTIELLVSGALASAEIAKFRSESVTRVDVQPRDLQYYIRTDEEMWNIFNAAFTFQVILSVFLDHATELFFRQLGLPIHSRQALSGFDYYNVVIDSLREKQTAQSCKRRDLWSLVTPPQLARVAAGVNPLCSISPKACLMTDALVHEVFMALCEGVVRIRPDTRVITIVDLEGGIRNVFPERLASELARVAEDVTARLANNSVKPSTTITSDEGIDTVRLCVRRLQATRTLLRKTFKVTSKSLLFAVFSKAYDRLHIREGSVIFVHDGIILSGRREARTLMFDGRSRPVQIFAVCKKAWASKQREAARRGHLFGSDNSAVDPLGTTRRSYFHDYSQSHGNTLRGKCSSKLLQSTSVPIIQNPPQQQLQGRTGHEVLHPRTGIRCSVNTPPKSRALPPLPPGLGGSGEGPRLLAGENPTPRRRRRLMETPIDGSKLDLGNLEKGRPLPPRPSCAYETNIPGSASTGALGDAGSRGGGGIGRRIEGSLSPRLERIQQRLENMEACLRDLDDSANELRSGRSGGRQSGLRAVTLAVITSQLGVASNLSSLFRQALSAVREEGRETTNYSTNSRRSNDTVDTPSKQRPPDASPDSNNFVTEVLSPPSATVREGQGRMLEASRLPVQSPDRPELEMSTTATHHDGARSSLERGGSRQQSQLGGDLLIPAVETIPREEEARQPISGSVGHAFYKEESSFDEEKSPGSFADSGSHEDAGRRRELISEEDTKDKPASKEYAPPANVSVYTEGGRTTAVSDSPSPDAGTSFHRQGSGHGELLADSVASVHDRGRAALLASTLDSEALVAAGSIQEEAVPHAPATEDGALLEIVTVGINAIWGADRDDTGGTIHTKQDSSVTLTGHQTKKGDDRLGTRREDKDWNDDDDDDDDDGDSDQAGGNWSSWLTV